MALPKVSMKLFIDVEAKKVAYAEADKDCANFLFGILSLPMAVVIRLLRGHETLGGLSNMYHSFENLDEAHIRPGLSKDLLLALTGTHATITSVPKVLRGEPTGRNEFYRCGSCYYLYYYSDKQQPLCLRCKNRMNIASDAVGCGYVNPAMTYLVMDDLEIKPLLSTSACISLINKSAVKKACAALKEVVVQIGKNEAVKLVKTSLHSTNVLTEVFITSNKTRFKD